MGKKRDLINKLKQEKAELKKDIMTLVLERNPLNCIMVKLKYDLLSTSSEVGLLGDRGVVLGNGIKNQITMSKYKGDIENFPEEVVEWMCDQQVNQGNPRDVRVFEKYKLADKPDGGFTWAKVDIPIECSFGSFGFCAKVIEDEEFYLIPQYFGLAQ